MKLVTMDTLFVVYESDDVEVIIARLQQAQQDAKSVTIDQE